MKYFEEGGKLLLDTDAMVEMYKKMLNEHPLVTYIEDAFGQFEFKAFNTIRDILHEEYPLVQLGVRQVFTYGKIQRFKDVTTFASAEEV